MINVCFVYRDYWFLAEITKSSIPRKEIVQQGLPVFTATLSFGHNKANTPNPTPGSKRRSPNIVSFYNTDYTTTRAVLSSTLCRPTPWPTAGGGRGEPFGGKCISGFFWGGEQGEAVGLEGGGTPRHWGVGLPGWPFPRGPKGPGPLYNVLV